MPIVSPVTKGEKPPIPVPLMNKFDTPYRYVDSNVLRSCSFDNLLTMSQDSTLNLSNNGDLALKSAYFVKFSLQRYKKKRKYF